MTSTLAERDQILMTDRGGAGLGFPLRDLPTIKYQRRKDKAKRNLQSWNMMGADTETISGRVWLFSTERGVWEVPTFAHLMQVLYNDDHTRTWRSGRRNGARGKRGRRCLEFFFFNLKFDAQAILRTLDSQVVLDLISSIDIEGDIGTNKVVINVDTADYEPVVRGRMVELSYLEGKSLTITPQKWRRGPFTLGPCMWWDISQFYGKLGLNAASQKYLNKSKIEKCFDGSILDASRFDEADYRDYYREDIDTYAIQDAVLTGELARLKREDFVQNHIRFIRPYSVANVAQRNLLDICDIPTVNGYKTPALRRILQESLSAYRGGWFETTGSGYHEAITSVDLASAYPYTLYHLPDINNRESMWFSGDGGREFLDWLDNRTPMSIGFCEAYFLFEPNMRWHPLAVKSDTGTIVTPRMVRGWFTADEVAEALKWPLRGFQLGRWTYFDEAEPTQPFKPFIERFYNLKMSAAQEGDSTKYGVSKVLLNSIYGKTIQAVNDKAGTLWNPMYAATVTGATRSRIAELVRVNDFTALGVATDGVMFASEDLRRIPNRPLPAPHNLGQWELEMEGELLSLMSGVYSIRDEKQVKTTFRGSASYFLRDYRERGTFGFCADNHTKSSLTTSIRRPYSAKEARMKGDMTLMNVFAPHDYTIRPVGDSTKRLWSESLPVHFGDLLERWWPSYPHQQV